MITITDYFYTVIYRNGIFEIWSHYAADNINPAGRSHQATSTV